MSVPKDILYVMNLGSYLQYVMEDVGKVLNLDERIALMKLTWDTHKRECPNESDTQFLSHAMEEIWQPILNKKLGRPLDHPTIESLLRHALRVQLKRSGSKFETGLGKIEPGTVVRSTRNGKLYTIKSRAYLKDGTSFLHYEGLLEGYNGDGHYALYDSDIEVESLTSKQ